MLITVEATYEGGVLKLRQPLPLDEHETVQVTVQTDKPGPNGSQAIGACHDPGRIEPSEAAPADAASAEEASDFAEYEMVDLWLNVPPSPDAITVVARQAEIWPSPYKIEESDLAPE